MPNWVTARGPSRITAVDFDGREPRIYVRLKADMCSKIHGFPTKHDYLPDLEEKAVELVLQQAELFAGASD